METPQEPESEYTFRKYANRVIVIASGLSAGFFVLFLAYHSLISTREPDTWLLRIVEAHYAGTIGVPLSAMSAFCVVLLLRVVNAGPIELEALGFKFKGAAGPVILWLFCFLGIIFGFYLLWDK